MTLPALAAFLRRRIVPLAACLLAGLVGGLLLTAVTPKTYKASTRLFVNIPTARTTSEAIQGVQLSSNLLESYARIATSRTAAERVAAALDKRFTSGQIASKLSATPQPNTLLIDVTATDGGPEAARDIADAGGQVLAAYVAELEAGREGAIEARVIDPARLPTSPASPKPSRNLAVGLLLGLVAGVGLALAMDSSSTTEPAPEPEAEREPELVPPAPTARVAAARVRTAPPEAAPPEPAPAPVRKARKTAAAPKPATPAKARSRATKDGSPS